MRTLDTLILSLPIVRAQARMDYPQLPPEFSDEARSAVMMAWVQAGSTIGSDQSVQRFILTVFSAYAKYACALGKSRDWPIDRVDREAKAFLRQVAHYVWRRYSHIRMPQLVDSLGGLDVKAQAVLENTPEWALYLSQLTAVAEIQSRPETIEPSSAAQPVTTPATSHSESPRKIRRFREPRLELLNNPEGTVNRKQAAEALGISERTLDRLITAKELTAIGPGSRKRFKNKELLRFFNRKKRDEDRQE